MPQTMVQPENEKHRKRSQQVNVRLSGDGVAILHAAQDRFGLTYTGVIEMALRELRIAYELVPNPLVHGEHTTGSRGTVGRPKKGKS